MEMNMKEAILKLEEAYCSAVETYFVDLVDDVDKDKLHKIIINALIKGIRNLEGMGRAEAYAAVLLAVIEES